MGLPSNFYTKTIDPLGIFRKGSRFNEERNKLLGIKGGNIYGIGDKQKSEDTPTTEAIAEEEKKKRVLRSHLVSTTDRGDILRPDSYSGRDQILGG